MPKHAAKLSAHSNKDILKMCLDGKSGTSVHKIQCDAQVTNSYILWKRILGSKRLNFGLKFSDDSPNFKVLFKL